MTTDDPAEAPDGLLRSRLTELLKGVRPWDDLERSHLATALEWIASGAPLYRTRPPDVPPTHLVCYFVVLDETRGELLLVAHRKAGLWLPTGGHVEPGEDPWGTVGRECREELAVDAVPSAVSGARPFFLTITRTRGQHRHTDVSLWYVVRSSACDITAFDEEEFDAIRWMSLRRVLAEPVTALDPHMHRFTRKLLAALAAA
ncbi:NUDIX hydrolase [Streptomyces odontomachi]|uniref:NUDIX hydrolase n=1 Tax=Streptomyces odontomachi TaxID=2944940 RepID=UPI00210ED556|nr:NUDIX domain-containing protein [Streptomyces sp. ODS25]